MNSWRCLGVRGFLSDICSLYSYGVVYAKLTLFETSLTDLASKGIVIPRRVHATIRTA